VNPPAPPRQRLEGGDEFLPAYIKRFFAGKPVKAARFNFVDYAQSFTMGGNRIYPIAGIGGLRIEAEYGIG
jgi:hypothetical protein